jgi:hypothetical protein
MDMLLSSTILKSYERIFVAAIHAQSCTGALNTLDFARFHFDSQKDDCFNFVTVESMGVGLGELRKGGNDSLNELSMKKNTFSRSNYN